MGSGVARAACVAPGRRTTLARGREDAMRQAWSRLAGALAALAMIAGCGGASRELARSSSSAVMAPSFGDADPTDWAGRGPQAHPVHGIDVSKYQGSIDWPTARAHGVSFAFIKATEGGDRVDPAFARHWQAAGEAGVARGAYHFFYFCTPAATQARWFIANVPRERGMMPPVLDMEWNHLSPTCAHYRPAPETVLSEMMAFLDIVGRHYGERPVVYTTPDFWERNELWRLEGEEVWLRATSRHPSEIYPGAAWSFWQYSGTGLVPGIAGEVDLNAFAGSRSAWADWLARRAI